MGTARSVRRTSRFSLELGTRVRRSVSVPSTEANGSLVGLHGTPNRGRGSPRSDRLPAWHRIRYARLYVADDCPHSCRDRRGNHRLADCEADSPERSPGAFRASGGRRARTCTLRFRSWAMPIVAVTPQGTGSLAPLGFLSLHGGGACGILDSRSRRLSGAASRKLARRPRCGGTCPQRQAPRDALRIFRKKCLEIGRCHRGAVASPSVPRGGPD
jgi:hypothetical protein